MVNNDDDEQASSNQSKSKHKHNEIEGDEKWELLSWSERVSHGVG